VFKDILMGEKYIQISVLKTVALTIAFYIFLTPYSLNINDQGVSVNYLFVLFPFLFIALGGRSSLPKFSVILYMAFLVSVFILFYFYQDNVGAYSLRRFASFAVFMSMFSFMFIKINLDMTQAFKYSVISFSVYTSIATLVEYLYLGGAELGMYAKGLVGTQRIGFVYILALWIILFHKEEKSLYIVIKHILSIIVIIGLLLTFSRTSIFALVGSLFVYYFLFIYEGFKKKEGFYKIILKFFKVSSYIFILFTLFSIFLPNTIVQYKITIINYIGKTISVTPKNLNDINIQDIQKDVDTITSVTPKNLNDINIQDIQKDVDTTTSVVILDYQDKGTSIGYRRYMTEIVLGHVSENPLIGSSFQGVWTLFKNKEGSAHSQYLDTLFRTGVIGFIVYILFLFKIGNFLFATDRGMFIGFIGILLYGLFHETFKLSQGAFILAFLFALYNQRLPGKH